MISVLVLASSPLDQGQLHLGKEHKVIKHSLDSASNRDQYRVIACMAATVDDLRRYLLEHSPTVVHFCGHGAGPEGLCFEEDSGGTHVVSGTSLAKLFHLMNQEVHCVVLNACFSEEQAKAISEHIDFVIGMRDAIGDDAALKFAQGFYEAVWAGESFERAFKFGCSAIDTAGMAENEVPVLLRSPRLGGIRLSYSEETQAVENFLLRYLNVDFQDRAQLTTEGSRLSEVFKEWYKREVPRVWSSVSVVRLDRVKPEYWEADVLARSGSVKFAHTYYLKVVAGGLLLDWKASTGYWPVPLRTLKALGSAVPVTVRVIAELDDYFNYGFEPGTHYSVLLRDLARDHLHGFMPADCEDCSKLLAVLRDGREHRIMVAILPKEPGTQVSLITRFISESWIDPSDSANSRDAGQL